MHRCETQCSERASVSRRTHAVWLAAVTTLTSLRRVKCSLRLHSCLRVGSSPQRAPSRRKTSPAEAVPSDGTVQVATASGLPSEGGSTTSMLAVPYQGGTWARGPAQLSSLLRLEVRRAHKDPLILRANESSKARTQKWKKKLLGRSFG